MFQSRLIALTLSAVAALLLTCQGAIAAAPGVRPLETRPAPYPVRSPVPVWVFADIHVTLMGPNAVKIEWVPLPGADLYYVYRNGVQIGDPYYSTATDTRVATFNDNSAPPNSTLNYYVVAYHMTTQYGLPGQPNQNATFKKEMPVQPQPNSNTVAVVTPPPVLVKMLPPKFGNYPGLVGWVDLHTHPMSNLAFAGKLLHGGPDAGSLMPAIQMPYDTQCLFDVRAANILEALSQDAPTLGNAVQSACGSMIRQAVIAALEVFNGAVVPPDHAVGAPGSNPNVPAFANWPRWNDITHQKMWWEWIQRAHEGGLSVMVALSHNSRLLAEAVGPGNFKPPPRSPGGPISGAPDDMHSSDLQIAEIKAFVLNHNNFMEVARTSADLYRIVHQGKLAIVLGVEIDNIGDFNDLPALNAAMIDAEISRLFAQGVRYIFPIHLTDNAFGDTAIYSNFFNLANYRETGHFWKVGCAGPGDDVSYQSLNLVPPILPPSMSAVFPSPPQSPDCGMVNTATGPVFGGHVNSRTPNGLTQAGESAINSMMKRGMIIDIDHMSNMAVNRALQIAKAVPGGGYPLMSGHSAVRNRSNEFNAENSRTVAQLKQIACLGGMFGLGTDGRKAYDWAGQYVLAFSAMSTAFTDTCPGMNSLGPGSVALGTDANSFVRTPRPTMAELDPGTTPRISDIYNPNNPNNLDNPSLPLQSRSTTGGTGGRTWDYNFDGVAHYGMFADFVKDVRTAPPNQGMNGKDLVDNHLMRSADYFWRMWQKIEAQSQQVK